jgi:hypothetical protein
VARAILAGRLGRLIPVAIGVGLIAVRVALVPATPAGLRTAPPGDGPWTMVVRSTGSPRDGSQVATLDTPPGIAPAFALAVTLPRYPPIAPGDRVVVTGTIRPPPDSPYGQYLARIGAVGTLSSRTLEIQPGTGGRRSPPRRAAPHRRRGSRRGAA